MSAEKLWLAVTGDLMMNRPPISGRAELSEGTRTVYDLLRDSDITFVNLEVPLTDRGEAADKLVTFRADPTLAGELRQLGADVVTVANNHALDYGREGFFRTLQALDEAGIPRVGGGRNLAEALSPAVLEAGGLKVAFVGLATTLPAGSAARENRPGVAPIKVFTNYVVDSEALDEQPGTAPFVQTLAMADDVERACQAVREAAAQADAVIVGIHWGVPHGWVATFQHPLATYQRTLGQALIDAGATAVIGNHAHVLHGIEMYKGRPIMHCLGNFMFHRLAAGTPVGLNRSYPPYSWSSLRSPINRLSVVARLQLSKQGVEAVELIPITLNGLGEPEAADPAQGGEILRMLEEMSAPLGTRILRQGAIGMAVPEGGSAR